MVDSFALRTDNCESYRAMQISDRRKFKETSRPHAMKAQANGMARKERKLRVYLLYFVREPVAVITYKVAGSQEFIRVDEVLRDDAARTWTRSLQYYLCTVTAPSSLRCTFNLIIVS